MTATYDLFISRAVYKFTIQYNAIIFHCVNDLSSIVFVDFTCSKLLASAAFLNRFNRNKWLMAFPPKGKKQL